MTWQSMYLPRFRHGRTHFVASETPFNPAIQSKR
jgi:hypothetical protein